MEFDKSRVFTALNAEEVKVGSKGYGSDTMEDLKCKLITEAELLELTEVRGEDSILRFIDTLSRSYALFYLVEEPKEKKYYPYYSPDEIPNGALLNIVLRNDGAHFVITAVDDKRVYLGPNGWVDMQELYDNYMWPNGTPCGKEDEE